MSPPRPSPTVVLVTGCSSGIGYELIHLFDKEPFLVVGTVLPSSYDDLMADPIARSPRLRVRQLDIGDYETADRLAQEIEQTWGGVDILINNAGISYRSTVEDMTPEDEQRQIQINYLGPMNLIRACLPPMRKRGRGRIINVSSVGGMMAMPTMASYSASKFALEGASEALWYELRPWGIQVSLVRPGFINSLAFKKVLYSSKRVRQQEQSQPSPYDSHYERMTGFIEKIMTRTPCTSLDVAKTIYKTATRKHPRLRVSGTPDARLFALLRRCLPRLVYHLLLYWSLPGIREWGKQGSAKP